MMKENNTKPELELYDVGHLYNLNFLVRRNIIKFPVWLQFVTGILGGIGANVDEVVHMKQTADRLLGSDNYIWSVIGAGYPAEFNLATLGIMMGGHARLGFEDNIFIEKGVLVNSNARRSQKNTRPERQG
jgi:uncharacterized protein (DUF849 family)